jgi:membrane-bound metal-dependent hydrolase YbcI (DUF457 family)
LIGNLTPRNDRALRNWCLVAAVAPDLDAISYLFGPQAYGRWHHTLGHNVFAGLVLVGLAFWHQRPRGGARAGRTALLAGICFAVHVLADAKLSAYAVPLFWPFSNTGYEFHPNLGLASPINTYLVYGSLVSVVMLAIWRRMTPLDAVLPPLDRILVRAVGPARDRCSTCARPSSQRCDRCGQPTCMRHAEVGWTLEVACLACAGGTKASSAR